MVLNEDYWASLEMHVCANSVNLTGSQTPVSHGQVGLTFRWKRLVRTLKPVLGLHFSFSTMAPNHQATPISTTPALSHQESQHWVCPRSKVRSLSSYGFFLGLSCWFTWSTSLPHWKLRNITFRFQLVSLFLIFGHQLFHCYLKNRVL